ncbi:MAG TPA: OmpA family protein [Steroidobacteraceae bacterium]|nr:OmpA family protein [Steroidobacteraceae bacterium]
MQLLHRTGRARPSAPAWLLPLLLAAAAGVAAGDEPPPTIIDSQSIVRSLAAPAVSTRGFEVAPKVGADSAASGGGPRITLDIRFASDSDQLTPGAQAQLAQLGNALTSPDLAQRRFLIAGHTSATGSAEHNQHLSEARARSVRSYLIEHFHLAPGRLEATGYGSSRPLPNFPPGALQQRRVEISTLPSTS